MSVDFIQLLHSVTDKLEAWFESFVLLLPNLVVALGVSLAFALASRFVKRGVHRIVERLSDNLPVAQILSQIARVATICLGLFIALGILELEKTVTSLLAGVGVIGLALGFAFQDTATNFVSGVYMALRRPLDAGDVIEVAGQLGTVERIELRSTRLRTFDGLTVIIPNKDIFQGVLVNYTQTNERRVEIPLGVAYSDDLELARDTAIEALSAMDAHDAERGVEVVFTEFGDSSINFDVRFWLDSPEQRNYLMVRSDAIIRLKKAFDAAGLTIPFPIRTLDFGAASVGGETLEQLSLVR